MGLVQHEGWESAGLCHWDSVQWVDISAPYRGRLQVEDYPPIIPYKIPFFQFHCVVSAAIKESPNNDFSIEYSSYDRNRKQNVLKQFIYRNGSPQSGSDERLTQQPNMYLRKIVLYRALPIDFRF